MGWYLKGYQLKELKELPQQEAIKIISVMALCGLQDVSTAYIGGGLFTGVGAILLLLVSNLLLWENVASVPLSTNETDDDNLYLKEFFDHAMILLHNISKLNIEMRKIYFYFYFIYFYFCHTPLWTQLVSQSESYDKFMLEYFVDQEFLVKTLSCCHNYSIKTPKNMDEIQKITVQDFPELILSRVQAWNDTLHNLLTILESTPGTHDAVLSIARDIRTKNAELFEDSKRILNKTYGKIEIVKHAVLAGLEDFQSSDEDFRLFALCKLSYCLREDMNMVNTCLQLLSCVMLVKSDVCFYPQIRDNS
ncbi:prolactin-7A2-like [Chionomys nivalis]|uniref:prolactin-7A2-like n=1 Tax=Chionomys nivalis TaxID=269649 RepID=UPI002596B05E|nr:prolactin-7A2-like [Chionomys nivalis]